MKYIPDSNLFEQQLGKCWKNTEAFVGYGDGFPYKVICFNFEKLSEPPAQFYIEHGQLATMDEKYYQHRSRQSQLLSLIFILKGEMYFRCGHQTFLAYPGDCVLLKPHQVNDFLYLPDHGPCTTAEIIMNGSNLIPLLRLMGLEDVQYVSVRDKKKVIAFLKRLKELSPECKTRPVMPRLAGLAVELLQQIAFCRRNHTIPEEIQCLKDELKFRMQEKINIPELASQYNLTLPELNRKFRNAFGTTPYDYLKQFRLKRAAELLRKKRVKEIAVAVGYETSQAFSAEFRRYYGMSPQKYKQQFGE